MLTDIFIIGLASLVVIAVMIVVMTRPRSPGDASETEVDHGATDAMPRDAESPPHKDDRTS